MNADPQVILLLGELKGKIEGMEKQLAEHRAESSTSISRLEGAVTARLGNHADRLTKLEHSRTRVVAVLSFIVGTLTIAGSYIGLVQGK